MQTQHKYNANTMQTQGKHNKDRVYNQTANAIRTTSVLQFIHAAVVLPSKGWIFYQSVVLPSGGWIFLQSVVHPSKDWIFYQSVVLPSKYLPINGILLNFSAALSKPLLSYLFHSLQFSPVLAILAIFTIFKIIFTFLSFMVAVRIKTRSRIVFSN